MLVLTGESPWDGANGLDVDLAVACRPFGSEIREVTRKQRLRL